MPDRKESASIVSLVVINLILVTANIICYTISSSLSRIAIIITFVFLTFTSIWYSMTGGPRAILKVSIVFVFSSLFFLAWRSGFFTVGFMEGRLNSGTILTIQEYARQGSILFNSAHSYFFSQPLTAYLLHEIGGLSNEAVVYLSLAIYGFLASIVGILVFKTIQRHFVGRNQKNGLQAIIPSVVGFMSISFAYSERSSQATDFSALLTLIAMWFLFSHRLRNRREIIIMTLAMVGITFGNPDGMLLLAAFFIFLSFFGRRTTIVCALIPISYLLFNAYSYTQYLAAYTRFALTGFTEFLNKILYSEIPGRVVPWQRTSIRVQEDVIVSSIAYLSIFAVSITVAAVLFFFLFKKRKRANQHQNSPFEIACLTWLLLWLAIATVVYVGASTNPETTISDIRTISIVLLSLTLPFMFMSTRLVDYLSSRKGLLFCLAVLMIIASVRTVYEVVPKSKNDPILVVEDDRLGLSSVYAVSDFIKAYYTNGGIVGDYKVLIYISVPLPTQNYAVRLLNETTISEPFEFFPDRSIIVYTIAGTLYPSIYHHPEAYTAAQDFSAKHNRLYDNGVVTIACQEKAMQP